MSLRRAGIIVIAAAMLAVVSPMGHAVADQLVPGASPGTVVHSEPLPEQLWIEGTGEARRLTYWTRTSEDQPALSTGAVFIPAGTPPSGGWPVVSWEHGTVGLGDDCAPSTAGRSRNNQAYLATWMRQGYAIVATDYIGLGTPGTHAYLDGRAEAHAAIDMVRAARAGDDSLSSKWVAIGQSQGGGAAVFTASLATGYAPDLDYRGAVATGPASGIVDVATLLGPGTPPIENPYLIAYIAYTIAGLKAARPSVDMDPYLSPLGRELATAAHTLCFGPMADRVQGVSIDELFSRPLADGDFIATARSVMDIPLTGYDRPLFIGQGAADTDIPAPLTAKLVADLVSRGFRPEVHIYPGEDHSTTVAASLSDSIPFVARLFA
ncbi:alpha/beta hydrolase [Nocardia sp. 004]|uniref:alpha/beta hydrolase n=1 Tax=Nocardia sp. 004 TaxID=3385978 RepID=UPI0039A1DD04